MDGLAPTAESRKCALARPGVLEAVRAAHRRGRLRVRVNAVVGASGWGRQSDPPVYDGTARGMS